MSVTLGVNLDHIATLREARKIREPDPVAAAVVAELAGADGITVHLRADRRHIQERDVRLLRQTVATHLTLQMAPSEEMVAFAVQILPDIVTLVPESSSDFGEESGLDVAGRSDAIAKAVESLRNHDIAVAVKIAADTRQVKAARKAGAQIVELDTGAQEAKFYDDRAVQVVKRVGDNARNFNSLDDYAILTAEIPEGKVLHQFILKNAPTWNNNGPGSDIDWEVYRWDNDYDTTFKGRAIAHGSEIDHKDNQDLVIDFGAKLKGGSRYLIVITASNDGAIGYWGGDTVSVEGWEFFENEGDDAQSYPACTYKTATYEGPEETEEPTPEETPTPEVTEAPTPTQAPTEAPTNTPEPAPTEEPTPEPKKSGCGNVIGGAFAIIAVAACALVIRKKH